MLQTLKRRQDSEEGFTLIELMVVVLIIAILLAIAIPTFLGAQDRARDRAAQSNLRNGITAAKVIATDADGLFLDGSTPAVPIDRVDLDLVEGSLDWVTGTAVNPRDVGVVVVEANGLHIMLNAKSASGSWFGMCAYSNGNVKYAKGAAPAAADAEPDCTLDKF